MSVVNIRHLRAFLAVAEHQHFTKAAETLHLTQPALSVLIKQLEEELDVKLVHRRTRNVELTAIGREFRDLANQLTGSFDDALNHVKEYRDLKKGTVTLAALPSLAATVLPEIIDGFCRKNPHITVHLLDTTGDEIIDALRGRKADVALTFQKPVADITCVPVLKDRLVLVGTPRKASAKNGVIRWAQLKSEPLIIMAPGTTIRALTDAAAARARITLDIVLEPRLMPTAIGFANAGFGCAILPSSQLSSSLVGDIPRFALAAPEIEREISLMHLTHYPLPPAGQALLDYLQEALLRHQLPSPRKGTVRN